MKSGDWAGIGDNLDKLGQVLNQISSNENTTVK
jgi:hypothetical protein